jgi:hypothetical protein
VALVAQALADPFRTRLERELRSVSYEPAPAEVGPVRQETDVLVLRDLGGFPVVAELAREFRLALRAVIWLAVDASGIHATITGVVLGLLTPTGRWVSDDRLQAILDRVVADPSEAHRRVESGLAFGRVLLVP